MSVALVTGANRGIGREVARQRADRGPTVVLAARDEGRARAAAAPFGATKTPADAAAGIVWLATLPDDGPTGGFFRDGQPIAF